MSNQKKDDTIDYLYEDPPVKDGSKRQNFCCISLVTPKDVYVPSREYYALRKFVLGYKGEKFDSSKDFDDEYTVWLQDNKSELDDDYDSEFPDSKDFIPCIKFRGGYNTYKDAMRKSKQLHRVDPGHDVFIAEVGKWVPCDGVTRTTETETVYANKQLQSLMKEKYDNDIKAKQFMEQRIASDRLKAMETDVKRLKDSDTEVVETSTESKEESTVLE